LEARLSESFRLIYHFQGRSHTFEYRRARIVLGRSPYCDFVLSVASVSRKHAVVERHPEGWVLLDQESRFGTFVNGRKVARHVLEHGDRILLGQGAPEITFESVSEPTEAQAGVHFHDAEDAGNVELSIVVEEFERLMGRPSPGEPAPGTATATETQSVAAYPAARPGEAALHLPSLSLLALFKQIGEVLLTSENLDDMLSNVLDLAMNNLAAQRGLVCLCDESLATIAPKATRIKGEAASPMIHISRSIAGEAVRTHQALLVTNARDDARFAEARSVIAMQIHAAMCAPLYHAGRVEGLIYVDTASTETQFRAADLELLTALGVLTAVGMLQARLRDDVNRERAIRARLSRYNSPRVVDQIVASLNTPDGAMLAEAREVSVLFADLCGFTSMAEGRDPAEVIHMLNCVFERLTQAVFQHEGTLDKYLGDGVLAIFGAPLPQPDHAERAIETAILMQQALGQCHVSGPQGEPLRIRIGINSGMVVAGDIGSPMRKDYTVIGDVINVASRLESSVAKAGQIVIGPATYELCKHRFPCEPLPEIRLKGKQQLVRPYLVSW